MVEELAKEIKKEKEEKKPAEKAVAKPVSAEVAADKPASASTASVGATAGKAGKDEFGLDTDEMMKVGLHFGHRTTRVNPKMQPYIYGVRNTVHLIDLEKTVEKFREALQFIQELAAEKKTILFVGTKVQHKDRVKEMAEELGYPYVIERWLGGTFTNFGVLRKRAEHFVDLTKKQASGELEKYTKKERIKINQELQRLKIKFEGVKELKELPEAIFVINMRKDSLAVKEAREKGVKVIGIVDTNADPTLADYPIPANDDAISSVKYILEKVKNVILNAKAKTK